MATMTRPCSTCVGSGTVYDFDPASGTWTYVPCRDCRGTGMVTEYVYRSGVEE